MKNRLTVKETATLLECSEQFIVLKIDDLKLKEELFFYSGDEKR